MTNWARGTWGGEDDVESFKAAGLGDEAVDHDGVDTGKAGGEVGADDVVGPGGFETGDGTGLGGIVVAGEGVLENPAFCESDVEVDGVGKAAAPDVG
jgi:hypothetical protein